MDADVIYLSTRHAPPSEQRIGPIASYLLDKRPCRIVIETDNEPQAAGDALQRVKGSPAQVGMR